MAPRRKPVLTAKAPKSVKPDIPGSISSFATALPPARIHPRSYHVPLLSGNKSTCCDLLQWFEGVEETRSMPWRKAWVDPKTFEGREEELGNVLSKRAYEIWVSEVSK